jgi:hypothetical protein
MPVVDAGQFVRHGEALHLAGAPALVHHQGTHHHQQQGHHQVLPVAPLLQLLEFLRLQLLLGPEVWFSSSLRARSNSKRICKERCSRNLSSRAWRVST